MQPKDILQFLWGQMIRKGIGAETGIPEGLSVG